MNEIKIFVHDGSLLLNPHYAYDVKDAEKWIEDWKEQVFPLAKEANADHYVYAIKRRDEGGALKEVGLYNVALDDKEFHKRMDSALKAWPDALILAWHKGTSY
jgi:hypothetical protein